MATLSLKATHNRAGEITYEHISGTTYKIIITTYTYSPSEAYRCSHEVDFGDGTFGTANRVNGPLGSLCDGTGNINNNAFAGESLGNDITKNIYEITHTYSGAGSYFISITDPDRNEGICNISNGTTFYIQSELIISPFLGANSTPILLNPPIDEACVGECFEHNPGAYDVEGDSLVYTLVASYSDGEPIPNYFFPPNMGPRDLDPIKGDLVWCTPPFECEYNIAILIEEYRRLPGSSERFKIGSVLRDMQIDVFSGCQNDPPQIASIEDTCIVAGTNLNFEVSATDVNNNLISLEATGGVFENGLGGSFLPGPSLPGNTSGIFNWNSNCSDLQLLPYLVTFKALDNHPTNPLTDFESVEIRVVAPGPSNLTATPVGSNMSLNWTATICGNTSGTNPLVNYSIYRKAGCDDWQPSACDIGVPSSTGFVLIGTADSSTTSFTDTNNDAGLVVGVDYSYLVIATYLDGSETYASNAVCEKLVRDAPIITNVSVLSTGLSDSVFIKWIPPLGDEDNLDTLANPPVYEIKLMQASRQPLGALSAFTEVSNFLYTTFSSMVDTSFISANINTQDSIFAYRLEFYSEGQLIGISNTASSVYVSSSPTDNQIDLTWEEDVPWTNYQYYIYRETTAGSNVFDLIDSTNTTNYSDTGLVNGETYCYKIKTIGEFTDTAIVRPLENYSQTVCDIPIDTIPPCQPELVVSNMECQNAFNTLTWRNPNNYCSDDTERYKVYFSSIDNGDLIVIDTVLNTDDTVYTHVYLYENTISSLAGCYAVSAIDSAGNESPIVSSVCVDNCPVYELPNVFTPNGDSQNDFFIPMPSFRYVRDVNINIYNRWGQLMFETTDINIGWPGTNMNNGKPCVDGVYFYTGEVNEIRLGGIKPIKINGFIKLINN